MKRLLVIRASAMGDVAILIPVLRQFLKQHSEVEIDLLTQPFFHPFFEHIKRINLLDFNTKGEHKNIAGLLKLSRTLKKNKYDAVLDLHQVLRSQILGSLMKVNGFKVFTIDKGRKEKSQLTRKEDKKLHPLKTSAERYRDVFLKAGFSFSLNNTLNNYWDEKRVHDKSGIGIAPFAHHKEKMWPLEKTKQLIVSLIENHQSEVFLFGGGKKETDVLHNMAKISPRVHSMASVSLPEQLQKMTSLKVFLSMDSSNMHMASAAGCPVLSIWQATHPFVGFAGFGQSPKTCIQRDDLSCRPCSVFGNKYCHRGDWACQDISVDQVLHQIADFMG